MILGIKKALRHAASIVFVMSCSIAAQAEELDVDYVEEQVADQEQVGAIQTDEFEFGSIDHLGSHRNNQCQWYSNNPYQCDRMPGCHYSRIYSQCIPSQGPGPFPPGPGPGPGPRFCSNYNFNYSECVQAGCRFDGNSGACYNGGQGPGPDGPGDPGPLPPQQPRPRSWTCFSFDTGTEEHRGGHAASAYNRFEAERQALHLCSRYHGRCYIQSCRQN